MKIKQFTITVAVYLVWSMPLFAQSLKVAVAANLQGVIKVLQKDFRQKTGIEIQPIVGSSGN
ncbi:MAG: molybdate ABC transporter substrate-binding protein, partial [Mucilaginibacter sp.]